MAIFSAGNINASNLVNRTQVLLQALRDSFHGIMDLQQWLAAQSVTDLEALGINATDLTMLQEAVADANALAQIYQTGTPPNTYPQPASAYAYAATQRQIIGPQ